MDKPTLSLICTFCLLLIVLVNIYMLFLTHIQIKKQQKLINETKRSITEFNDDIEMLVTKVRSGVEYKIDSSAISILDLAEFKDLDPYIKAAYRRHILDVLTPAITEVLNKSFRGNNLEEYLQEHDAEISRAVYNLSQKIKKDGINTILP